MDIVLRIDLDLFMMLVCIIMYQANNRASEKYLAQNRLFRCLLLFTTILLGLEVVNWLLDGRSGEWLRFANYVGEMLTFLLTPLPSLFWTLYVLYQVYRDPRKLRRFAVYVSLPIIVCALLVLANPFTSSFFSVDAANYYHRGPLFILLVIVSALLLCCSIAIILFNRRRIPRDLELQLLLFMVPPIIGATLQIMYYGLTLMWSSIGLSLIIIQTNVQTRQVFLDHLTKVFNRRQLDVLLADRIHEAQNNGSLFSCVLLDVDQFKAINDTFGHITGDEALKDAAEILQSSIRKGDVLARYAGDEFVILTDITSPDTLRGLIARIHEKTKLFNSTARKPYALNFSAGFAVYDPSNPANREDFLNIVDAQMYQDKNSKL